MDLPNVYVARLEFKDYQKGLNSQHFHVDVALVDRSTDRIVVYQLKSELSSLFAAFRNHFDLNDSAFQEVGELLDIDENKKIIRLKDKNILSYKHLIVFTSNDFSRALSKALATLKDALILDSLNIQKIFSAPQPEEISQKNFMLCRKTTSHTFSQFGQSNGSPIKNVIPTEMISQKPQAFTIHLSVSNKALYHVKL